MLPVQQRLDVGSLIASPGTSASSGADAAQALFREARRRRRRRWLSGIAVVQYLDLTTGKVGTAGPGQTVFLSADGRYLLMSQTARTLTQTPVTGGTPRQLTLPLGWYLPGGDGLPELVPGQGLATANGIIVQSAESPGCRAQALGLRDPPGLKVAGNAS